MAELLRARYDAVKPGHHMNKRHWNTLTLDGSLPDALVRLIDRSYKLVVAGLPKAKREGAGRGGRPARGGLNVTPLATVLEPPK